MPVGHTKNLAGASNGNSNQVQPADWNATHALSGMIALLDALTGTADKVLCFDSSGNPQLLPKSQILTAVSPNLTGTPTAPTASLATNSDQIATTAFVVAKIAALVASAPGLLDTLDEIAAALGDDPNFATTMTGLLALKAPLASPALTGNPTVPTQAANSNNTRIANTAYADNQASGAAGTAQANVTSGLIAAPGAVIGSSLSTYATNAALSTVIPNDDTAPLITEGDQIFSVGYTPKSTTNKLRITFRGTMTAATGQNAGVSLWAGSTLLQAQYATIPGVNNKITVHVCAEYTPGAVSSQTISVRAGGETGPIYFNGNSSGRLLGGSQAATLLIEEIKA